MNFVSFILLLIVRDENTKGVLFPQIVSKVVSKHVSMSEAALRIVEFSRILNFFQYIIVLHPCSVHITGGES